MKLKIVRWIQEYDFRSLSHLDGSLTKLCAKYKLKDNDAVVFTSMGWHRLRLVARISGRSVMIIPETHETPLQQLAEWVAQSMRDGIVMLGEFKSYQIAKEKAA